MDNQHRKISGYRDLCTREIELINEIKSEGARIEDLIRKTQTWLRQQEQMTRQITTTMQRDEDQRICNAQPTRWVAIASTHFQEGLMALTRAIAQPTTF